MRNRSLLGWLGGALLLGSVLASAIDTDPVWGADGIWSASANGDWSDAGNWSGGFAADGSGSTAFFNTVDVPTAGIVVSLDAPRTIGHLAFDDTNTGTAGSWTLAGPETLTLAGTSPSITVGSLGTGASATIATAITGSDGVTKAGTGTLTLAGANSYTGGTTVSTGALKGTIDSIRGDVSINAGATVQFQNPASNTIANKITGDGVFRVFFTGGGHVWINGLADFTGTVQLSKPVANGGKWTATGIGTLDAALIIDDLCQIYVAGPTTFNKGITVSGIGNTEYRGAIRLSNTLGGDITLAGDTTIGCENGTITGNITSGVAGTQTLTFAGAVTNRTATVLGSITDGVGTLALTQNLTDGTLRLAGNNSYSGLTTITKGTVQVGTGGTTGTLGTGNVVNDGALVFNRSNDLTVAKPDQRFWQSFEIGGGNTHPDRQQRLHRWDYGQRGRAGGDGR